MKTGEELKALKNNVEALNEKLAELSGEELEFVTGGFIPPLPLYTKNLRTEEGWEDPKYILGAEENR